MDPATSPRPDPRAEFTRRLDQARLEAARVTKRDDAASNARLGLAILAVVLGVLAWQGAVAWAWAGLAAAGFVPLVAWHGRVMTRRRRAERVAAFHEKGIARVDGHWAGAGATGARFLDEEHPYAADLDLFGVGSLFERLCAARTAGGEAELAGWLLRPAPPADVEARHEAIRELRDKLDFREDLALLGDDVRTDVRAETLAEWGTAPRKSVAPVIRINVLILTLVTTAVLVATLMETVNPWYGLGLIAVEAALAYAFAARAARALDGVEDRSAELVTLAGLIARIERERFDSPALRDLAARLGGAGGAGPAASAQIGRLARLVRFLEARHNVYFALFTSVLLWRTQFAFGVEAWREREGANIPLWLDVIAKFEAYASLAGYSFENPADPFGAVVADADGSGPFLVGEEVGHPLLPPSSCVRNSLDLGADEPGGVRVLAISGSNMSGKSTFLRTIGINAVLAQAGAPVRARSFRLTPVAIAGTLRVHDSLQEGRSRFYAEILRLKRLMDMAREQPPLFFLIDEVLHGTNSTDRLEGAGAVIRALVERGALGLFTTHDLVLAEVAGRLGAAVANVHFADHVGVDGRLAFDYRMRPGVVQQSNALALMRAVGLEV